MTDDQIPSVDPSTSEPAKGLRRRRFLTGTAAGAAVASAAAVLPMGAADPAAAATRRADPQTIPGSKHFATMLAFGDFEITEHGKIAFSAPSVVAKPADGEPIQIACLAIQGLSGVSTEAQVTSTSTKRPQVKLERFLTHFKWDNPDVLIEQNPYKKSWGTLTGYNKGGTEALLPGTASFHQYLILTVWGRPLVNVKPMIMTADDVTAWPPVNSHFSTEGPTDFYEMSALAKPSDLASEDAPSAEPVARLAACTATVMAQVYMPSVPSS